MTLQHFANPYLLFICTMTSMAKSSSRSMRVVTITRQSLFLCKEDGAVKRTIPIEAIFEVTATPDEILIHIPPACDVLLKNDGKKEAQEELITILETLHKFHHGERSQLVVNLTDDNDLQMKARLPDVENVDAKAILDDMLQRVKMQQKIKIEIPPPPPDRTEEIEDESAYLEEKSAELESLIETVENVLRSNEMQKREREAQLYGVLQERDALIQESEAIKAELAVIQSTLPEIRLRKNIVKGTNVVASALLSDLQKSQQALVQERAEREEDVKEGLISMRIMYDGMLLRKQDEIDALEAEVIASQNMNETLQLAVDNVVRTTAPPPNHSNPSAAMVTSPHRRTEHPITAFPQMKSQREYFLRKY
jgi:hypothetical protein